MPPRPARKRRTKPITLATVRQLARALPEAEEGATDDRLAFRVRGKLFAWLHASGALVVKIDQDERALRMQTDPATFWITDHYLNYPAMLVRLESVYPDDLRQLIEESWRRSAPKRLSAELDGAPTLRGITERLERHRQAATYAAIAGVVGASPRTLMKNEHGSHRNSWVVSKTTRRPTGYRAEDMHPDLAAAIKARGVIDTAEGLAQWLERHR